MFAVLGFLLIVTGMFFFALQGVYVLRMFVVLWLFDRVGFNAIRIWGIMVLELALGVLMRS